LAQEQRKPAAIMAVDVVSDARIHEGGRMNRRRCFIGLAMFAGVGSARAQMPARRLGALLVEPSQVKILESILKDKGCKLGGDLKIEYRLPRAVTALPRRHA